jgi:hypothetical protein
MSVFSSLAVGRGSVASPIVDDRCRHARNDSAARLQADVCTVTGVCSHSAIVTFRGTHLYLSVCREEGALRTHTRACLVSSRPVGGYLRLHPAPASGTRPTGTRSYITLPDQPRTTRACRNHPAQRARPRKTERTRLTPDPAPARGRLDRDRGAAPPRGREARVTQLAGALDPAPQPAKTCVWTSIAASSISIT